MVCRIVDNTFRILKQILSQYYTLYRNSMQLFIIVLSSQKYCTTTWIHNLHAHNISSLSIIISLQQSNETYKHIKSCQHNIRKKSVSVHSKHYLFVQMHQDFVHNLFSCMANKITALKWWHPTKPRPYFSEFRKWYKLFQFRFSENLRKSSQHFTPQRSKSAT